MDLLDLKKCFDRIEIYKHKNSDPIRDCSLVIDHLNGKTFKSLSTEQMSHSEVRRRIYTIYRKIRCSFSMNYPNNCTEIYALFYEKENVHKIIPVFILYKDYLQSKLDSNDLYKPFKKDIIKIKKISINKHKCSACNGAGYIHLEGENHDT